MKLIKRLFFFLLIAAAVYLGYFIKQQGTGFVLIQYREFSIETSVFVFSGLMLLLFIVCYFLLRSFFNLVKMPSFISNSYQNYQNRRSSSGLVAGLTEFSEGHFKKAENLLIKQASANKNSFLNYLLAARAAQLLHVVSRRDQYLKLAYEVNPDADIAIGITQAELQLSNQQNEMALATLNQLNTKYPKHDYIMRLIARAYLQLEDWKHLCPLLKDMRQNKSLPEEQLLKTEKTAFAGYLKQAGQIGDTSLLDEIWQGLPKVHKSDADLLRLYASQLIATQQHLLAEKLLRDAISKQFNEGLLELYASFIQQVTSDNNERYFNQLLDTVERWLQLRPHHAMLLLTAGKICAVLKLWGKARSFFDSSLSSQPMADTYLQIAQLLEQTEHTAEAQKYYRLGLNFCLQDS